MVKYTFSYCLIACRLFAGEPSAEVTKMKLRFSHDERNLLYYSIILTRNFAQFLFPYKFEPELILVFVCTGKKSIRNSREFKYSCRATEESSTIRFNNSAKKKKERKHRPSAEND